MTRGVPRRRELAESLGIGRGAHGRINGEEIVVLQMESAFCKIAGPGPHGSAIPHDEFVMHQVSAFFFHRLGKRVQTRGSDCLRRGGVLGVHGRARPSCFTSIVKNLEGDFGGHAFQRLEDLLAPQVVDCNIQRMFGALNEFDEARNRLPIDLRAVGLEEKLNVEMLAMPVTLLSAKKMRLTHYWPQFRAR